jgi:ATP-dependent RNA helicase SUPV3L1/SUV3
MHNGTFGVTGNAAPFEEDLVVALESHDFEPVRQVQWRNSELDFASLDALRASLEVSPQNRALTRVPIATDQQALEFLSRNEAGELAIGRANVELMWQCCALPDYRDISPAQHGEIITRIYTDLRRHGAIATDWIAEQVRFCDNVAGDIDTLSNRIRQIRTWTYVANRKNWLEDPAHWREKTRDIEDRLSDALHERLTQRFVDRRTSVLMRHLRDRSMATPEINDRGEISLEGHLIGSIQGFRFTLARSDGETDAKSLASAAAQVVAPEIAKRADRLAGAPNEEFVLSTDGQLRWRGEVVASLAEGDSLFAPRLIVLADESLTGPDLERVQDRVNLWLRHHINTVLEPVLQLEAPTDLEGSARGLAYRLYENLGLMPRQAVSEEVKGLDQDVRAKLRKLGVKFGAYHIYVPLALKPAPRELALILYGLKHGGVRQPGVSELPHTVLSGRTSFQIDPEVATKLYEIAGFKVAGKRAVRVDILERLADIIRPLIALDARTHSGELPAGAAEANGFRVTVEMTSLLGTAGEDFASILTSLGYRVRRTPKVVAPVDVAAADAADAATNEAAMDAVEGVVPQPSAAETANAATNEAAKDAVESEAPTDPVVVAEEAAVAEAAEDLGASLPHPETIPEPAKPTEPEFDEVWFPGGRRPDNPRHEKRQRYQRPPTGGAPPGVEGAPTEGQPERKHFRRPDRDKANGAPGGKPQRRFDGNGDERPGGKPKFNGKRNDKPRENWKEHQPREKRNVPLDPDSPWAALAALRNPKQE